MTFTFNGTAKTIVIGDTGDVTVTIKEIYSRWKDWVVTNGQWEPAFRTFGGDPLSPTTFAGDYYFLNNAAGWRIKPEEKNHILTISGNLYPEDIGLPLFAQTIGGFNVNIKQDFSSLTQTVNLSGSGGPTAGQVAEAVWDSLKTNHDLANSFGELLQILMSKLSELHKLNGLDISAPVTITPNSIVADNIEIELTGNGETETIMTRT